MKVRRFIRQYGPTVTALGVLIFILSLPARLHWVLLSLPWWRVMLPSRETLLIIFCCLLVAWVAWIDIRPSVYLWIVRWRGSDPKEQLQQFYGQAGDIIERTNTLTAELQASEEIKQFIKSTADWIGKNMGQAARYRFLDLGPDGNWASSKLWNLKILRQNLVRLIEKDDWH